MKLINIAAVSVLSSELRKAKEQVKAINGADYKKGVTVTLIDDRSLRQDSFTVDLDAPFIAALTEALDNRIKSIEKQIESYGVEL